MSTSMSAHAIAHQSLGTHSPSTPSDRRPLESRCRIDRSDSATLITAKPGRNASRIEQLGVIAILIGIWCANGRHITDTVTSGAVFLGFLHAQLSFDLAESIDDAGANTTRSNLRFLFMAKEGLWFLAFMAVQSWPLVFGSLLFSCYPLVRAQLRCTTRDGRKSAHVSDTRPERRAKQRSMGGRREFRPHPRALRKRARPLRGPVAGLPVRGNHRSPSAIPQ